MVREIKEKKKYKCKKRNVQTTATRTQTKPTRADEDNKKKLTE